MLERSHKNNAIGKEGSINHMLETVFIVPFDRTQRRFITSKSYAHGYYTELRQEKDIIGLAYYFYEYNVAQ